jgi:2-keto-3-deoxy-galactonokinase
MVTSRMQWLHAFFLKLAARRRALAEKASNADLAETHLRLAAGYEAMAETFAAWRRENNEQHAFGRQNPPEVGRYRKDDPLPRS